MRVFILLICGEEGLRGGHCPLWGKYAYKTKILYAYTIWHAAYNLIYNDAERGSDYAYI